MPESGNQSLAERKFF